MNLRCPDCCSEGAALTDRGRRLECGNCGVGFTREEALVTIADAEAELQPPAFNRELFRFDRVGALEDINDPDGALWLVNAHSDADELNLLLEAAQSAGILTAEPPGARLYVYPLSISESAPLLAVSAETGPTLLGQSLKLHEAEAEDPIAFTLRLLTELADDAGALVAAHRADSDCLDRIAAYMNRPGQWNGGDVCEVVAKELQASGRELPGNAEG